jgi:nucleoside-diphosphate-sugar epimerase
MRILIVGNGFLATGIAETLEQEGHDILVFARTKNRHLQTRQILGDIFNFEEFIKIFSWNPKVVIHTAWITTPGLYRDDLINIQYANFTTKLAQYVLESDLQHLVILGTCAEYGLQIEPSRAGITKLAPLTLYAQQKVAAFNSVIELMKDSHIRLTWARIFYPFGPNQDERRLIPILIRSLLRRENIILDDITSVHDWITTRDISSAISWILKSDLPVEIDIGTSLGYTNLELLQVLEKLLKANYPPPSQGSHHLGLNEVFVVDKQSALLTSGWSPKDTLKSGLEWVLNR